MKFLVQKFGGTSLASPEFREIVALKVISAREKGYMPVVVVSAIGREDQPYATDSLLGLVRQTCQDVPGRELDLLMSCGEIISGVVMTATLKKKGYQSTFLTGAQAGIITSNDFGEARIIKVQPKNIIQRAQEGNIIVVAGFQGVTENGEITTLGRGGSDTTAAALGVALEAEYIEIYTDVEGIMTADPNIVKEAKILEKIAYDEICHLANEGAKVVHPRAIEIASQKNVPIRVRSAFSDAPGTLVACTSKVYKGTIDINRDKIITGIAQISGITQFRMVFDSKADSLKNQRKIFREVAQAGISIDFINVLPGALVFTVKAEVAGKTAGILEKAGFKPCIVEKCAKVSCVGAAMTGVPGVVADIVEALTDQGIQILQCNDSHTTIWVLVKLEDMEEAIRALHNRFLNR